MSFICDKCGVAQKDRIKPHRVVVRTRQRVTPAGLEIAKEENHCPKCYIPQKKQG
jgi:hypothetical protein